MSVVTWKYELSDEGEPRIVVEYPDNDEVRRVIGVVEDVTRNGFGIRCDGSCCKAPQGINWTITIEFEAMADAVLVAETMRREFGEPETSIYLVSEMALVVMPATNARDAIAKANGE